MASDASSSGAARPQWARYSASAPPLAAVAAVVCAFGLIIETLGLAGDTAGPRWSWTISGAAAGAACLQRAVTRRFDQLVWFVLAGAMILGTIARFEGTLVPSGSQPTDLGHTLATIFPILLMAGGALVLHDRLPTSTWAMRIDGISGLLGGFAIGALVLGEAGRSGLLGQPTDLAIAPILVPPLAGVAVGSLALSGGRGGRVLWAVAGAMACVAAGNAATIVTGGRNDLLGVAWAGAIFLVALAAALDQEKEPVSVWTFGLFDTSVVMGFLALAVVIWGFGHDISPYASLPAMLALVTVNIRGVLTRHEARSLIDSRKQARTDDLTGLANRRYFYERVDLALAGRAPTDRLSLLIIDLDRFKEINDSLGHHAGDEVLRRIGPRWAGIAGVRDVLSRLGGDEFAVLIDGGDPEHVLGIAHRLRDALTQPFLIGDVRLTVDASVGVAMWPEHADNLDDLMARADISMYRAKSERSGVRLYEERGDAPTRQRLRLLELLRTAVHSEDPIEHGLVVHYQPKLRVATGEVVGVEALVRFDHPDGNMVFPDLFISMVESAGLMMELTTAVMRIAVRQCQEWREQGVKLNVAVNVSTSNLLDLAFPHHVMRLLNEFDLSPSALSVEVTESSLMADRVRCLDVLHRLRAVGIKISVDDYGTGHSSLAYLKDLPADELKLDRAFVQGMADDPKVSAIVESTVALAHALDLCIVAEGVETDEDLDRLRAFDVDVVQGYLFSRALTPAEIMVWYRESYVDSVAPLLADNAGRLVERPGAFDDRSGAFEHGPSAFEDRPDVFAGPPPVAPECHDLPRVDRPMFVAPGAGRVRLDAG